MSSQKEMGITTHFQALIDLQAWQVFGFEGLARFDDGRGHLPRFYDHVEPLRWYPRELATGPVGR